jgi:hypothetical protein
VALDPLPKSVQQYDIEMGVKEISYEDLDKTNVI